MSFERNARGTAWTRMTARFSRKTRGSGPPMATH